MADKEKEKVSFLGTLLKLGTFVDLINNVFKVQIELTDGDNDPVDLHPIAADLLEICQNFNITLPPWANNIGTVMTFIEGGLEKVAAAKAAGTDLALQGHADINVKALQ